MNNKFYIPQTFIKDKAIQDKISDDGYAIISNIDTEILEQLRNKYKELHKLKTSSGAMFYSIYSQDLEYRKLVYDNVAEILKPILREHFIEEKYKNIINSFIIKTSGKKSEFALHQDSSIVNESKFSQLSLWIPLQDTTIDNGTLCIVPKTHKLFLPYRGNSIEPPFQEYEEEIRKYLIPIELKAGDILAFDYRLVHYSPANSTKNDRIVALCGLFEHNASIEVAYKDSKSSTIEIFSQTDDYLLTNKGFHLACNCKPESGIKIREVKDDLKRVNKEEFIQFAKNNNLKKLELPILQKLILDSYTVIDPNYKASIKEVIKDKLEELIK